MSKKKTININKKMFQIIISSIFIGVVIVFTTNLFSKNWFYKVDRTDNGYVAWSNYLRNSDEVAFVKIPYETPIIAYEFNSIFGSQIEKYGKTGFIWRDFDSDGWSRGHFDRGKFSSPIQTFSYQVLLTLKDWKYILMFSLVIIFTRLFFGRYNFRFK